MIKTTRLIAVLVILTACPAAADILVGPWTFDDRAFADDVVQLDAGELQLYCDAAGLEDALLGYSPERQLVNTGALDLLANDFVLLFRDLRAWNELGPDLVFFESRFSADAYEIAVRPLGGDWSAWRAYESWDFLDTGDRACADVYGLEIELDDFGLAAGSVVDGLRFRALAAPPRLTPEGDPVMAAVLHVGCPPAPDSDGDGIGDACDCAPFEADDVPPGEPVALRIRADRSTFEAVADAARAGDRFHLHRGELGPLRASTEYDLTCVDSAGLPLLTDATLPGPDDALYYLITAADCLGNSHLGARSDGRLRTPSPLSWPCP